MKKILLIAALTLPAAAMAGTEAMPQMDVDVITQGTGAMGQEWLVPVTFLLILLLAIGSGGVDA